MSHSRVVAMHRYPVKSMAGEARRPSISGNWVALWMAEEAQDVEPRGPAKLPSIPVYGHTMLVGHFERGGGEGWEV